MMSSNGSSKKSPSATPTTKPLDHPGPVSLNMLIGPNKSQTNSGGGVGVGNNNHHPHQTTTAMKNSSVVNQRQSNGRESNDTLSQLEQQFRSIEANTMAAQRLREELAREPDTYLRYREHEDLLGTINHEPER